MGIRKKVDLEEKMMVVRRQLRKIKETGTENNETVEILEQMAHVIDLMLSEM